MRTDYDIWERQQVAKLRTVINAAKLNNAGQQDLEIKTCGYEPSASVRIAAKVLDKYLSDVSE